MDFQRLVDNLISNAVKATNTGGVAVTMSEQEGTVILEVADTGAGISPEHLEKIFWRFYRIDRNSPGNGLGLPIVQGIAEMYGGRVEVKREIGKGTTSTVTLPSRTPGYNRFQSPNIS